MFLSTRLCINHFHYYYYYSYRFHSEQKTNPDHRFNLPEDFAVVFVEGAGEMVVGGVFLRLFIANPGWVLRKPREFLTELLEKWCAMTSTNSPNVCVCDAFCLVSTL